jgi:gas vesicle protein
MDDERKQELFEEKYADLLGLSYEEWLMQAPENETEAYARLQEIDDELKGTEDEYYEAVGDSKSELEEYRSRLKNEYQMLEEMFGLESRDE